MLLVGEIEGQVHFLFATLQLARESPLTIGVQNIRETG